MVFGESREDSQTDLVGNLEDILVLGEVTLVVVDVGGCE